MTEEFKTKLLILYPNFNKVLGVYTRKDGRQHIILNNSNLPKKDKNRNKTLSYPKAIMEVSIGRKLLKDETVDHIDKNPLNNESSNLQILSRSEHAKLDVIRRKEIFDKCSYCGKTIKLTKSQIYNRSKNMASFCSKKCSGIYGTDVQNNRTEKIEVQKIKTEYFCNKEVETN